MSNEQKLREAIKRLLKANRITVQAPPKTITDAENQLREIENAVKYAEEALATTEPVMANGPPQSRDSLNKLVDIMRWVDAYAYDYAKEGKFAKSRQQVEWSIIHELNKIPPASKQSLQVEQAINQQLTTEFDEREAFESEMAKPPFEFCMDRWPDDGAYAWPGNYAAYHTQCAWVAWQARAAMAKGVKG